MFFWISLGLIMLAVLVLVIVVAVSLPRYRRSAHRLMATVDEVSRSLQPLAAEIRLLEHRLRQTSEVDLGDEAPSLTTSEIEEAQQRRVMAARAARAKYRRLRRTRS
ncbi:hypothetical protein [Pseudoclavibacter sp. 13-3]|uniref:hypothetical protein n=1 Tax=Pseudoclavibacter sp. 13-3 TaxID=2901228 RepID=UPI001E5BC9DC|nr:hypothetical protein [Pseudoclavibacter sp. 13-3]MCD7101893.1 hypothetical protein [Pseudoclavibacter sp. 13-3]